MAAQSKKTWRSQFYTLLHENFDNLFLDSKLGIRILNCFYKQGIHNTRQMLTLTDHELANLPLLGRQCLEVVKTVKKTLEPRNTGTMNIGDAE